MEALQVSVAAGVLCHEKAGAGSQINEAKLV